VTPHVYDAHVRFSDVDVYGHVNNVKYFEYYQEARIAFIASLSEPYAVETWVTRIGTTSYDLSSRILDAPDGGELYSRADVRLVAFDLAAQRSRPLTDLQRSRLEQVLS
jgi:acyl-CoA thioester hydrolase